MKKFFVLLLIVFLGLFGKAQDISYNFLPFDSSSDTFQITTGVRFGSVKLSPIPEDNFRKKLLQNDPKKIGVGNFILDTRVRIVSDSLFSHDGVLGMNLSLLRSKMYLGYQYSRPVWYASVRFGYEIYRMNNGEVRAHTKLFSENIPILGFECGFTPQILNQLFRFRFLSEYDFGNFGWYGSGIATLCVYQTKTTRFECGTQYDGLYGYGFFGSVLYKNTLLYCSTFQGQFPFQETRFPEQKFGMQKGISFGIQQNFR
jgi:hypothetical protein